MAETTTTEMTTSATTIVDASPSEIFEYLRRPANHAAISGDGTVTGSPRGAEVLTQGDKFNMGMKQGLPYRVSSKVVEFEQDRRLAWCHLGRHRWRWELEPTDDGRTRVTETFDLSPSPIKGLLRAAMKLPGGHTANVARSVDNVAAHFAAE